MSNSSAFIDYIISEPTVGGFFAIFLIFTLFYLITFPFYVLSFNLNRMRDKNTLLFPTVSHFYEMVKFTFYLLVLLILCIPLLFVATHFSEIAVYLVICLAFFIILALYQFTETFHFIIFLLAAQRFLVFYFPSTEKHIALFQKFMSKKVWYVHLVSVVKEFIILCVFSSRVKYERVDPYKPPCYYVRNPSPETCCNQPFTMKGVDAIGFYTVGFILFFHALLFFSMPFYIPIMISVRKLSSTQYCKVQSYIHWQTLTIFVCKSMAIVLVIYNNTFGSLPIGAYTFLILVMDIVTTPLTVQLSYLGSNGVSFQWRTFFRELFGGEGSSTVAPQLYHIT